MQSRFFKVLLEESRSIKNLGVLSIAFKRLWTKSSKAGIILAVVFSNIEAWFYTLTPIIIGYWVDVLGRGQVVGWDKPIHAPVLGWISYRIAGNWLTTLLPLAGVCTYGAFNISTALSRNATYYSQITFGTEAFAHLLKQSLDFHVKSEKGKLLKQTDDAITNAQNFLYNSFFFDLPRIMFSFVLILANVYFMDRRLFFITSGAMFLGLYLTIIFGSRVSKEEKAAWKNVSQVQARALDVMQNVHETIVCGNEDYEAGRRHEFALKQLVPLLKSTALWRYLTTIQNIWQNLILWVAMFFIVLHEVYAGHLSVGKGARFIAYHSLLFMYFMNILFKYLSAQRLIPQLTDLKELLDTKPSVVEASGAVPFLRELRSGFNFERVGFWYFGENEKVINVFRDVNLEIKAGEITVIEGRTGSGKTTFANMLLRIHDPCEGTVYADGIDLREFQLKSLRRSISYVSQQPGLFRRSIAENIGYSRLDASREEIIEAAKIAQAHEFICQLPNGYDTIVAEGGRNFSGGQRERLALARAILAKDAQVVVFDEPTTGLDALTAKELLDQVLELFRGKTMVIITHDQVVKERADNIFKVENGLVVPVPKTAIAIN